MLARIVALAVALLCAAASPAQTDLEQRLDAVKEFQRFFRKFKQIEQKIEAIRTLEIAECVPAAEALVDLFDNKSPEIVRAAVDVLSGYKSESTFAAMVAALPELDNRTQQTVLIEVFGRAGIKSAAAKIEELICDQGVTDAGVRFAAARAIGQLGGDRAGDALRILLDDSGSTVRMAACDSVGALDIDALGPRLVELLGDSSWQVQIAAVRALGKVREPSAVEPIIELMAGGGRVVEECGDALFHITGMDLGTDAEAWRKQWERLQKISGWRIPTDAELAKKAESRKRYDALYGKSDDATSFGGIKTTSTRILFIIDVSGSMDDVVTEKEKFDAEYRDYRKLTIVKTELARTIEGLGDNTLFNIVAFASEVKPWKKFLVPANVVNKASASRWVEKLEALGGKEAQELAKSGLGGAANLAAGKTNTYAALLYPFGIDPEKTSQPRSGAASKSKLDTVFFLSDGRPSTGKVVDEREILRIVNEINAEFRITFHVIAIGDFQKALLEHLAHDNEGVFVDLGR
ncbi:MAG: HEAT repeat domain-containing protein [Planctomycetes bacterium]|nr:HEAT repeat domain-containing protein [Planctomycetota bacterium]